MTTKLDHDPDTDIPDPDTADTDEAPRPTRRALPSFGLSATQLAGTALAAITATVAASYLGVTGTVIGAALASVLTAVGNAVYTTSLRSTRDRVREVVPLPARVTRSLPARTGSNDVPPTLPSRRPRPHPEQGPTVWKRAAAWAVGVFVVLMAVVTGVEVVAGRPVSDLVRGDSGGGTSFFGHDTVTTKTVPPTAPPAPTVTLTVTPEVVLTTPTVTRAAPATTVAPTTGASTTAGPTTPAASTPTPAPTSGGSSSP